MQDMLEVKMILLIEERLVLPYFLIQQNQFMGQTLMFLEDIITGQIQVEINWLYLQLTH
jgi:hypothetical protein